MANNPSSQDYTLAEFMCIVAAREFQGRGAEVVLLGMGLPVLSGTLSKLLHNPEMVLNTEVGCFDWRPTKETVSRAPLGISDVNLNYGAAMLSDMVDGLGTLLMGGNVDAAFLTAAQVDKFGNLNTLLIGDYLNPIRRLGGTGGNTEAACLARRLVTMMSLEPRRFVERCDFITSPAYIDGPGARRRAGLGPSGPSVCVSTLGIFRFDTPDGGDTGSCEMYLDAVFPGVTADTIKNVIPWDLKVSPDLKVVEPPTEEELHWLRFLDNRRTYLVSGRY